MKKYKIIILFLLICVTANLCGTGESARFTKPYTIMIYMNGSDLESEEGMATDDIIEMLQSGVNSKNVNILIFTGGTNRWHNNLVPENNCVVWEIIDGSIYPIAQAGLVNMGDPGTLADFINFSYENFPAERYGLIMWDHGGGSIAGYGHDEKFNNSSLKLTDMRAAFDQALKGRRLEFLGFDSCLMATVEMAVVASDYAKYLIASEDTEPAQGWNYSFLSVFNSEPYIDGADLGVAIVDYFMYYYGDNSEEALTLSVTDLSNASEIMTAMGRLMSRCSVNLLYNREPIFRNLALRRNGTKTFGTGSPRDNQCDMVDAGDMAHKLSDMFPIDAGYVLDALDRSVIYNRHNSNVDLKGLSAYYIYGGIPAGQNSLTTYSSLNMDRNYTSYQYNFYNMVSRDSTLPRNSGGNTGGRSLGVRSQVIGNAEPADELRATVNGINVRMYKINEFKNGTLYAIPAKLNGRDCDIIVSFNKENPAGHILGARLEDGYVIQKGYDKLELGDRLVFYTGTQYFDGEVVWEKSEEITVTEDMELKM